MNRLQRLYAINESVRRAAPSPISARALAEEFGVSRRTIERDLEALRRAGVPLYADYGRTGGQHTLERSSRGSSGVVVSLTVAEVTSLLVALAAGGRDLPFNDAGATATKRLLDGLPDATRVSVDELRSRVQTIAAPVDSARTRVRRSLEQAIEQALVANITYTDSAGISTKRSVDCAGFFRGEHHWFLIGWCHLREDARLFRLDRISAARLTKQKAPSRGAVATLGYVPFDTEHA